MANTPLTRIQTGAVLRALLFGVAVASISPAFADNLPEVQKLIRQGQFPQALNKVDAYLVGKPKDAQGRFLKGLILTEMNRPNDAIAVFTKLTEDYPELPEPYNNLAVLYAQQKQYDKARTALEMAIRTHPSYAIAYENLGDIYAKLASQAYDKALQIDSSNPTAQNKLALIRDLISNKPGSKPEPTKVASAGPQPVPQPTITATTTSSTATVIAKVTTTTHSAPTAAVVSTTPAAATSQTTAKKTPPASGIVNSPVNSAASDEIQKVLSGWASAWSRKDVRTYLAYYSSDFKPPKGMSRKEWETQREQRIAGKGGKIEVRYDEPSLTINGDKATVKFRQHYKATGLSNSTTKVMTMVRSGNKWLIQDEQNR